MAFIPETAQLHIFNLKLSIRFLKFKDECRFRDFVLGVCVLYLTQSHQVLSGWHMQTFGQNGDLAPVSVVGVPSVDYI